MPKSRLGRGLNVEIVIYVPSTTKRKGKDTYIGKAKFRKRITEVKKFLSKTFGGTTKVSGEGGWYNEQGKFIGEKVAKVESFMNVKDYRKAESKVIAFIRRKKSQWKQDAISYYINKEDSDEGLHFI